MRASGGAAIVVAEEDILRTQVTFAGETGLDLEAASIVGVHVARRIVAETDGAVVVIATSSGLKDPIATADALPIPPTIPVDVHALEVALRETYDVDLVDLEEDRRAEERAFPA